MQILVLRHLDELPKPVVQLLASSVGERIHGAFRASALARGLLRIPHPAEHSGGREVGLSLTGGSEWDA